MYRRLTDEQLPLPAVFGHEGAGVVERVGTGVKALAAGDHVVLTFDSCGMCSNCRADLPAYCCEFRRLNTSARRRDGSAGGADESGGPVGTRWFGQSSFATHAIATERNAVRVDPELPLELLAPFGCGIQTGAGTVINVLRPQPSSSIAVFGVGAVGFAALLAARYLGVGTIIAVDVHARRLELARELGATHVLAANDATLSEQIANATVCLNAAIDTTGLSHVISTALAALGVHGRLALLGTGTGPLPFDPSSMAGRSVTFSVEGDADPQTFIPHLVELWRIGRFPVDRLVRTYPLDRINEAVDDSLEGSTVKSVLTMITPQDPLSPNPAAIVARGGPKL
jgi:aryl-alcohol dehydrogenase